MVHAQAHQSLESTVAAGSPQHQACTKRLGQLHRHHAHAGSHSLHEHRAATYQPPCGGKRIVRCQVYRRQACRLGPGQLRRRLERHAIVDHGLFGVAGIGHGHDPVTDGPALDLAAQTDHVAGHFQAGDVRRTRARKVRLRPIEVGAIETCTTHPHEQFSRPGNRVRNRLTCQCRASRPGYHYDRFHPGSLDVLDAAFLRSSSCAAARHSARRFSRFPIKPSAYRSPSARDARPSPIHR